MLNSELVTRLAIPGLPEWTGLVVLLLALLVVVAFVLMPFSVFGVKSRLDALEAQLDDIQQEIRSLALRLPETPARRRSGGEESWDDPPVLARSEPSLREDRGPRLTPPIPPPAAYPEAGRRAEPRLGGPRR
ncbi:hypothetical protein [Muricoccus radiodurans]|uniref:hypothetical protein n=1 Tax=Muricoccus radiodurans TaxID=2231721 RepID=UPI003CE8BB24